jgi:hypothetical protein
MIQAVTAREQDGMDVRLLTIMFEVDDGVDLMEAVRKASEEYIRTEAGRAAMNYSGGSFNWADFDMYVPNEICEKYGFRKMDGCLSQETSWDEQLIDEDQYKAEQEEQESLDR